MSRAYREGLVYPLKFSLLFVQELEDLRRKYLTKKGPVQKVMGQMRLLSSEDKVHCTSDVASIDRLIAVSRLSC